MSLYQKDLFRITVMDYDKFSNFIKQNDAKFNITNLIYDFGFKKCNEFYCNRVTAQELFNKIPSAIKVEPIQERYFEYEQEKYER